MSFRVSFLTVAIVAAVVPVAAQQSSGPLEPSLTLSPNNDPGGFGMRSPPPLKGDKAPAAPAIKPVEPPPQPVKPVR